MNSKEFKKWRNKLNKTQQQMARLLSVSIKAIHSYEQGWRNIPPHVERQMLFLLSQMDGNSSVTRPCWVIKKCHPSIKVHCPAWEFNSGKLCWFVNGDLCHGEACKDWGEKVRLCRSCEVLQTFL